MRKARVNGLVKMKRQNGSIRYDLASIHKRFLITESSQSTDTVPINIDALSEVFASVLHERPDLVKMISGSTLTSEKPTALKAGKVMTKAQRKASVKATYRNAYLREIARKRF